jgi:hypothetical protein
VHVEIGSIRCILMSRKVLCAEAPGQHRPSCPERKLRSLSIQGPRSRIGDVCLPSADTGDGIDTVRS